MTLHRRPATVTLLAGSIWLLAAVAARAEGAPANAPMPAPEETAGSGTSAGVAGGGDVLAVQPVDPDRWRFSVSPYLWMSGVKSSTRYTPAGSGHTITANVDESFSDIFSDLNFAFMAGAEARRGLYSVQIDAIYSDVLQKGSGVRSVTGPRGLEVPIDLGGKVRLKTAVVTVTGGYDIFRNDVGFVQIFGGFRYLGPRSKLDWNFQGPLGNLARAGTVKSEPDIWNGVAGLRGEHALGDGPWKAIYYIDVGAGGSKLTWEGMAQVAYVRGWGDIGVGWKSLDFEQSNAKETANLRMSGPVISFTFRFGG